MHSVDRWEPWHDRKVHAEPAAWARDGSTDLIPAAKLPEIPRSKLPHYTNLFEELHDAPAGITIARGTSSVQQALTLFDPSLTLAGTDHGVLLVSAEWSIASGSTSQLSLPSVARETNQHPQTHPTPVSYTHLTLPTTPYV